MAATQRNFPCADIKEDSQAPATTQEDLRTPSIQLEKALLAV